MTKINYGIGFKNEFIKIDIYGFDHYDCMISQNNSYNLQGKTQKECALEIAEQLIKTAEEIRKHFEENANEQDKMGIT